MKLLGITAKAWRRGFPFTENLQAPNLPYGWGGANTYNHNWGFLPGGPYSNVAVARGSTVPVCPAHMPRSMENPRAAARRIRDDFRHLERRELMRRCSRSRNPIVNLRFNSCSDYREGPITQYILLKISVVIVCNFSLFSISSVSTYLRIACRIAFCVIRIC